MTTRMWEGPDADLDAAWAALEATDGFAGAEAYRSGDRLVLVTHWRDAAAAAAWQPPDGGRDWLFHRVR